jgi:hypothetical protein
MAYIGGGYGGYGGYGNYGNYGGYQNPWNQGQYQQNSTDIYTGGGNHFWRQRGHFFGQGTAGYGLNLNQQPGHQRGQDGVLVFDMNRDGKYDKKDVQNSNDLMKAATGNYDFNNDGKVDLLERIRGNALRNQYRRMDTNRDGRLDTNELANAGGKVWVDHSRGGGVSQNELYSPYSVPGQDRWGRHGSQRLDFVDPFSRTSHTSPNYPYFGGWGGGGCGCGAYNYGGGGGHYGRYY